jgi:predicted cupin superfamily sugar epimerase
MTSCKRADELIQQLHLTPHVEGGYYARTYRSSLSIVSPVNGKTRCAATDIYFLLTFNDKSCIHRVIHDEIWHFYEGAPLKLVDIQKDTLKLSIVTLGDRQGFPLYKHCIKGGNWQAAYSTGEYTLAGCTVAPGFEYDDFEILNATSEEYVKILERNQQHYNLLKRLVKMS